jgi:alanine racemase
MPRPLLATIDISAMRSNLSLAKAHAGSASVWAVVKANGYGHGLANAMCGFAAADGLAVVEPDAAVRLREMGWRKRVLLLEGYFDRPDLETVSAYSLDTVVHCEAQLAMLETFPLRTPIDVHLKINSGMNRLGFRPEQVAAAHARLRALAGVGQIVLVTHFANADDENNPVMPLAEQVRRTRAAAAGLEAPLSMCNSAADLLHGELAGRWVRPGIMLYGATPGVKTAAGFGLLPAMTLASRLIAVQDIVAGEGVGYGSRFVAQRAMRIGVIACGYADGYPRHAPDGTPVLVDGMRCGLAGRVSMDMMTVDLSAAPAARQGAEVILWGDGLPIDEVAQAAGTIGYELMCAVAPRVAVAVRDDQQNQQDHQQDHQQDQD